MNRISTNFFKALAILILLAASSTGSAAQSSVVSIPSTDTQTKGTTSLIADFYAHFDTYEKGGFQSVGPSIVFGVKDNLEIGINYYYLRDSNGGTSELQPNIKWKAFRNEDHGISLAAGTILSIPLNNLDTYGPAAMFYTNVSKTFDSTKGTRLTAGLYGVAASEQDFGTKTGAMFGFEQPVTPKVTILADWTSGNNRFGYSNIGFGYAIGKSQYLSVAYTFGNSGRRNNFVSTSYGFTF